jgi:hypothetical protein
VASTHGFVRGVTAAGFFAVFFCERAVEVMKSKRANEISPNLRIETVRGVA